MKRLLPIFLLLCPSLSQATITFSINFKPDADLLYTEAEKQMFRDGLNFWDSLIDGHQDNVDRNFVLDVDAFSQGRDGGPLTLGSAGPRNEILTNAVASATTSDQRYWIARTGFATFNTHADAGDLRADVVLHEIGHTLGIGTLWEANEVYNDGDAGNNYDGKTGAAPIGRYSGVFALAAFQTEFNSGATFVPVEQGGGVGTANNHWDEIDGGSVATGVTDGTGRDFRAELMTGWAAPNEADAFVSNTTIQSLRDIGFTLHAVPEPSSVLLLGLGSLSVLLRRKR